jgi:hypothetical protein
MKIPLGTSRLVFASGLLMLAMFAAGYLAARTEAAQPNTVIHVVSIQWKQGISEEDKRKVLHGVKEMADAMPGVKNVWIKSERVEPRGFDDGFAIEFRDRASADAYASNALHKVWNDRYLAVRAASVAIDLTNN